MEKVLIQNISSCVQAKHLIVPTQYYDPGTLQVNHLVKLFLVRGWYVTVTAVPLYPSCFYS